MQTNRVAILVFLLALIVFTPSSSKQRGEPLAERLQQQADSLNYYKQRTMQNWELMQIRLKKINTNHHE